MSKIPINETIGQRFLYHQGAKRVGAEAADEMNSRDVRIEGVRRLGYGVAKVAVGAAAALTGVALVGNAIDNSPTTIEQRRNAEQQELHPDPTQAQIVVELPEDHGE